MKRIYILNGHPAAQSLNGSLAEAYADAARAAGHEVRLTHLHGLDFDPDFGMGSEGYQNPKPLEPALEEVLDNLEWSQHVVLTSPMWWGGVPAKLKGLFDRALLPGRTFNTRKTDWMGMPTPMLSGRTGRMILTSDTPGWFMGLVYRNALVRQLRSQIFGFIGVKPARVTWLAGASEAKPAAVTGWLDRAKGLGAAAA